VAGLELREVPASEALTFARVMELAFGNVATDEEAEATAGETYDPEWAIGVYDSGRLVATAGALSMELTVPAGPGQPFPVAQVPGVTGVAVLPTHRRRGLLNQMMAYQLEQFRHREVPLAMLMASESVIYGRYGYGIASSCQSLRIATERSTFLETGPAAGPGHGNLRLLSSAEATEVVPAIHDRARRLRPGEVSRFPAWWASAQRDPERFRDGGSALAFVVHEGTDEAPDGYASYRYHQKWDDGLPSNRVEVKDLYGMSPEVEAALWRFLLDIDLVDEVSARTRPLDETLRWRLAEPRRLRTTSVNDSLWARLVDVPAALSTRGYSVETELVLEVSGPANGRYHLTTGTSGASCRRAKPGEKTDLVLGLSQLGAIYLGGCRPFVLAAAGLVQEPRPGALARADAAFASPVLPFCGTHF
jgi:predicted acetyltransferase